MIDLFEGIPRKALVELLEYGGVIGYNKPSNGHPALGGMFTSGHANYGLHIWVWDSKPETMAHEVGHMLTWFQRNDPTLAAAYKGTDGERGFLEWMACNFAAWVRTRKCDPALQAWFEERYGD